MVFFVFFKTSTASDFGLPAQIKQEKKLLKLFQKRQGDDLWVIPEYVLTDKQIIRFNKLRVHGSVCLDRLGKNQCRKRAKTKIFPVCWLDGFNNSYRINLIKSAISREWEAHGNVRFTGWKPCEGYAFNFIRIRWSNAISHSSVYNEFFGAIVNLNSKLSKDNCNINNKPISVESCIEGIAVHEFGHILGFSHEQDRSHKDILPSCKKQLKNSEINKPPSSIFYSDWDFSSVLNYCNKSYLNGRLSKADRIALKTLYPFFIE